MVFRSGAGPKGCPITKLTSQVLEQAFLKMRDPATIERARELGKAMAAEDGVAEGVKSFEKNLPIFDMICEVSMFLPFDGSSRLARVYCQSCALKMCCEADQALHRDGSGRERHVRAPYRPSRWGVVSPENVAKGLKQGLGAAAYEMAGGIYDLFAKPVEGAIRGGAKGYVEVCF